MHSEIQGASHETTPRHGERFSKESLCKLPLLMISALGNLVALFLLASTRLHKNQLTPSMLFDAFVIVFGLYLLYTITGILIKFELPNIRNRDILGVIWEFIVFLASGASVHLLDDDTTPTLLFDTTGFYITGFLSFSILLLGEVIQLPVSGFLDTLRGLNVAISFSLYNNLPMYTYIGIGYCFLTICAIRMLHKWRKDGQQMNESGSSLSSDELQLPLAVDRIRPFSPLVEIPGHDISIMHTTVDMTEHSRSEFIPTSGEMQGQDSPHLAVEIPS